MTGCWHRDNTRITKGRRKNWNMVSVGCQEARCLLEFVDFFFVWMCVYFYSICKCIELRHASVHIWEIIRAGLDMSMCAHVQMWKNNA